MITPRKGKAPETRLERTVPYNLEAEEATLGGLLIDREAIIKVRKILSDRDFYRETNGWVFEAMLDLLTRREPADVLLVQAELDRRGRLEACGGPAYLFHLVNATPTAVHVEYYASLVRDASIRRQVITLGGQQAALGYDVEMPVEVLLNKLLEQTLGLVRSGRAGTTWQPIGDVILKYTALRPIEVAEEEAEPDFLGIPTGMFSIDDVTHGHQDGDLVIIAGNTGDGKSTLAGGWAEAAAAAGRPVGFFSLEMSDLQVAERSLARRGKVSLSRLRARQLTQVEVDRLMNRTAVELDQLPLFIYDRGSVTLEDIRALTLELLVLAGELGTRRPVIFVDYLQLIRTERRYRGNRVAELDDIANDLKAIARDLDVCIVALAQYNREAGKRADPRPRISDIRGSGAISQAADLVYLLWRPWPEEADRRKRAFCECHLAKFRNGPPAAFALRFRGRFSLYEEWPETWPVPALPEGAGPILAIPDEEEDL